MTIKQFMCGYRSRAALLTMLLLSGAVLLGTDPAEGKSYQQAPRSQHIPSSGQNSVQKKKKERISQAKDGMAKERRIFKKRCIEMAEQSEILGEKELIEADLNQNFCNLAVCYQRNVEKVLSIKNDQDFLKKLNEEQCTLRKGSQHLMQALQRSIAKKRQEKCYQEQFPSLGDAASSIPTKKAMRIRSVLNAGQEKVTTRHGFGSLGTRVATVDGLSVATIEQGFDRYVLEQEGKEATKRHNHPYINYIITHILKDPGDHYFPFSIDDTVLRIGEQTKGHNETYGSHILYTLPGTLGGNKGTFEIGVGINKNRGSIFHRMFRKDMQDVLKNLKKMVEDGGTIIR
ncbi:hypothetical protein E3J61_00085 [Candidatus Dependentiae bacterium]|nr:MAG: hypothetical protein E3J61_00085 [Candidatus Dependentiae bacterium]